MSLRALSAAAHRTRLHQARNRAETDLSPFANKVLRALRTNGGPMTRRDLETVLSIRTSKQQSMLSNSLRTIRERGYARYSHFVGNLSTWSAK